MQWERVRVKVERNKQTAFIEYKNANLLPRDTKYVCNLTDEATRFFDKGAKDGELSGRGSHAVLKIARSIADLEGVEQINSTHLEEAFSLRKWSDFLPDFL